MKEERAGSGRRMGKGEKRLGFGGAAAGYKGEKGNGAGCGGMVARVATLRSRLHALRTKKTTRRACWWWAGPKLGQEKEREGEEGDGPQVLPQPFKNMWIFSNLGIGKREKKGKEVKKGEGVLQTKNRIC